MRSPPPARRRGPRGTAARAARLAHGAAGQRLRPRATFDVDRSRRRHRGAVLPAEFSAYECRNNRLAWLGLNQDGFRDAVAAARERYGAGRVAVVLGTSTASIGATEEAYERLTPAGNFPKTCDIRWFTRRIPPPNSCSACWAWKTWRHRRHRVFLERQGFRTGRACSSSDLATPCWSEVSIRCVAACCSGSTRWSWFRANPAGLSTPARRHQHRRSRGFCVAGARRARSVAAGFGESSDAHHMSTPHPSGRGARLAMTDALGSAASTRATSTTSTCTARPV